MVDWLVQVALPFKNSTPNDVSVNTWSFQVPNGDEDDLAQVGGFMQAFYEGIAARLSPALDLTNARGKFYDRADPDPRTPVFDETFDLGEANTGGILPEECACCLSFQAVLTSGTPAARRRGRVFLGPLADTTLEGSTRSAINTATLTTIRDAYIAAQESITLAGVFHQVWSTTDNVGRTVVRAWVDNAFDTIRSRGPRATTRVTTDGPW